MSNEHNSDEAITIASLVLKSTEYILRAVRKGINSQQFREMEERKKILNDGRFQVEEMKKKIPETWSKERDIIDFRMKDMDLIGDRFEDCCIKSNKEPYYYSCQSLKENYLRMLQSTDELINSSIVMSKTHDK